MEQDTAQDTAEDTAEDTAQETEQTSPPPPPPFQSNTETRPPRGRLYRTSGPLSGVSGGLGDYFGVDPTLVRLAMVAGTLVGGPAVPIAYIAAWIIIPEEHPTPVAPIMDSPAAPSHPDAPTPAAPPAPTAAP